MSTAQQASAGTCTTHVRNNSTQVILVRVDNTGREMEGLKNWPLRDGGEVFAARLDPLAKAVARGTNYFDQPTIHVWVLEGGRARHVFSYRIASPYTPLVNDHNHFVWTGSRIEEEK